MKIHFILLSCFALLVFIGCEKASVDPCVAEELQTVSLETEYGCIETPYQMDINAPESFAILRNQTDFNLAVTGSCLPEIDFDQYDLIIGKKQLTSGVASIAYDFRRNCDPESHLLTVEFTLNPLAIAPNLTFHALVPKLDPSAAVSVETLTVF